MAFDTFCRLISFYIAHTHFSRCHNNRSIKLRYILRTLMFGIFFSVPANSVFAVIYKQDYNPICSSIIIIHTYIAHSNCFIIIFQLKHGSKSNGSVRRTRVITNYFAPNRLKNYGRKWSEWKTPDVWRDMCQIWEKSN